MEELTSKQRAFLLGLRDLTKATGVGIGGCGCCGSPYLTEAPFTSEEAGYGFDYMGQLAWFDPSDERQWKRREDSIVTP